MSKVKMPALSGLASGNLTSEFYYASYGQRTVGKKLVVPKNPRTAAQTANREGCIVPARFWRYVKRRDDNVEAWERWANVHRINLPGYHAFLSQYKRHWKTRYLTGLPYDIHDCIVEVTDVGGGVFESLLKFWVSGVGEPPSIGATLRWGKNSYCRDGLEYTEIPYDETSTYVGFQTEIYEPPLFFHYDLGHPGQPFNGVVFSGVFKVTNFVYLP